MRFPVAPAISAALVARERAIATRGGRGRAKVKLVREGTQGYANAFGPGEVHQRTAPTPPGRPTT
ncbi:hypothetical protein OJF2_64780 [Aquisphaera giovannonii]|uniref:Uncharacterized protein n=1 Tax=Aquisphaera giovannonii TaxID=406548 RepID=A0A5B9WBB3_9BACT|nr:hypothetical protein [Aquisphaera giovannonii]QEH37886.1 hypothetical protein OJF2_64780 [Aquisphaera giovannonii]